MSTSTNVQRITYARARRISDTFSTVDLTTNKDRDYFDDEVSLFLEGPGHEDAATRIAALINEQVARRDAPKADPEVASFYDRMLPPKEASQVIAHEEAAYRAEMDGPTYDGPDDEQLRYETEERLDEEKHLRAVRRDDKPWTPHEDEVERDVREGRRDADGEPF